MSPQTEPSESAKPALDAQMDRGDDRAALDTLMVEHGATVLAFCEKSLADLGDPSLFTEARHETFIEAFRSLNPLKSLPDPERFLLEIAARQCAVIRKHETARKGPRDPYTPTALADDWQGVVRWEIEVILQERPEGPDRMARRLKRRGGPRIWPAILLGALTIGLLWYLRRSL